MSARDEMVPNSYIDMLAVVQTDDPANPGTLIKLEGATISFVTDARPVAVSGSAVTGETGSADVSRQQFSNCIPTVATLTISKTGYTTRTISNVPIGQDSRYTPVLTYYYTILIDDYYTLVKQ